MTGPGVEPPAYRLEHRDPELPAVPPGLGGRASRRGRLPALAPHPAAVARLAVRGYAAGVAAGSPSPAAGVPWAPSSGGPTRNTRTTPRSVPALRSSPPAFAGKKAASPAASATSVPAGISSVFELRHGSCLSFTTRSVQRRVWGPESPVPRPLVLCR